MPFDKVIVRNNFVYNQQSKMIKHVIALLVKQIKLVLFIMLWNLVQKNTIIANHPLFSYKLGEQPILSLLNRIRSRGARFLLN
jgi:hypothetical protein